MKSAKYSINEYNYLYNFILHAYFKGVELPRLGTLLIKRTVIVIRVLNFVRLISGRIRH